MSKTLTAMVVTPGVTYCTRDGTPYRADWSGIVHVLSTHVTEMATITPKDQAGHTTGNSPATASNAQIGASFHAGTSGGSVVSENT